MVGETPNLAARLQHVAAGNTVVISPVTYDLSGERFEAEDLGTHSLKGIADSVQAWRVIAPIMVESRFETRRRLGLTPLIGREHEIGLLLDRWSQAKEGDGQIILLSGEPGIGKSRATESLLERTSADNPTRIRYQCSPFYTHSALHPVIEQIERAAEFHPDDTEPRKRKKMESLLDGGMTDLESVVPLFAALLSIPTGGRYPALDLTPERQKEMTLEAVVVQMLAGSHDRPVLIVFEDVHWADPTSLEMLEILVSRTQDKPVMVVITFRPEFVPPWTGYTHVVSLTLSRFPLSLVDDMVSKITGGKSLPEDVLGQIAEKTDGVPLFVEELTPMIQ